MSRLDLVREAIARTESDLKAHQTTVTHTQGRACSGCQVRKAKGYDDVIAALGVEASLNVPPVGEPAPVPHVVMEGQPRVHVHHWYVYRSQSGVVWNVPLDGYANIEDAQWAIAELSDDPGSLGIISGEELLSYEDPQLSSRS